MEYAWTEAESRSTKYRKNKAKAVEREKEEAEEVRARRSEVARDARDARARANVRVDVTVPREVLGVVIGKKGTNLQRVEQKYGVKLKVQKDDEDKTKDAVIAVEAKMDVKADEAVASPAARRSVEAAARELRVERASIPVEAGAMGWVRGKGAQSLTFLQALSGALHVQTKDNVVDVFGTPGSLESLRMALETHLSYRAPLAKLQAEDRELDAQLDELALPGERKRERRPERRKEEPQLNGKAKEEKALPNGKVKEAERTKTNGSDGKARQNGVAKIPATAA